MSDPSSAPLSPRNPVQALRHAPAPHHISFSSSSNSSTPTATSSAPTPRLAPPPPELSISSSTSPSKPTSNVNQDRNQKNDKLIPIYVRLVPRDLWLRFHVDQRSTIGALKDTVLEKVGAASHDPSLSSYFYEEAGRSESLSLSEGVAVPSLPRSFQAKKPKPPPAHHAYQKSLSGSSYPGNQASTSAAGSSGDPSSSNQNVPAPKSPRSRMSGLSSLAPLGLALSSSSGSSSTGMEARKASSSSNSDQLNSTSRSSVRPEPLNLEEDSLGFQEGIEVSNSTGLPLAMPSSPPSRAMWEQRRKAKGQSLDQPPSSPSSVGRSNSTRATPSAAALGKRAVSTVLEESSSNSPSPTPHSTSLPMDLANGEREAGGALRGNEEALRLEREALENLFSSRKSVFGPRASGSSSNNSANPISPPLSPSIDSRDYSQQTTPVLPSTSAASSPKPNQGFRESPVRNPPVPLSSIKRPTRRKVRDFVGDEEFDSDDLVEDSTSDDESETRYSLNDDWSESGRGSRASMASPEPAEDSPRMTSAILTTTDGERLWGTQLEEALKLRSLGRDGEREKNRRSASIVMDPVGATSADEAELERSARKVSSGELESSSSSAAAAAAARRRSGTITMAGRKESASNFSRPDSLDESEEQEAGKDYVSRGELSDGNSIAKGSSLSSSSSRKDGIATLPSNLTESSLMSNPRRNDSEASFGSSNSKNEPTRRELTPSTSANTNASTSTSNQTRSTNQAKSKGPSWNESSNSPSARRIAGINPDEISVWRNASHGLSKYYSVYSFANGHLMEDWRTVAAFRVRPFELFEIQYSNPSERAYLPRSSNLSAGSGRQSAGEIGIDEKYAEPFSEGWYYVHKPGSGPSKMRKAGVGVWKLRWITVRGWRLTVHRKQPLKGENPFVSSSSSPSWHLGTIKWISSEPAEIPVKPLLPSSEPLAPETLYIAFSTSGNILSSLGGNSSGATSWSESQSLALRCITPMDHEAMFRLLTRAHYRYSVGRVDPAQSLEIESWRRKAIARAIIAGRGGTVIPGRAGRRNGRNSLSRTRLRPSGVSRDWDDADKWSSQSEEETILPKSLFMGDGIGTGAISRAVEAARKDEEAKKQERKSNRGSEGGSSLLLNTSQSASDTRAPITPRNETNLLLNPSTPINQSPNTPSSIEAANRNPSTSQNLQPNESQLSADNPSNVSPSSVRSRGFSLSRSRKGGGGGGGEDQDMSRSMSGDSLRFGSGEEESSFSSSKQSANTSGRSWRSLRPGSSGGRSRSYTVGTTVRPSTSGGQ